MTTQAPLFDTHQTIERLIASGDFEKKQAEAIAEAVNAGLSGGVATNVSVDKSLAELETRLTSRMSDNLKWTVGTMLAIGGFLYAAIKDAI